MENKCSKRQRCAQIRELIENYEAYYDVLGLKLKNASLTETKSLQDQLTQNRQLVTALNAEKNSLGLCQNCPLIDRSTSGLYWRQGPPS